MDAVLTMGAVWEVILAARSTDPAGASLARQALTGTRGKSSRHPRGDVVELVACLAVIIVDVVALSCSVVIDGRRDDLNYTILVNANPAALCARKSTLTCWLNARFHETSRSGDGITF